MMPDEVHSERWRAAVMNDVKSRKTYSELNVLRCYRCGVFFSQPPSHFFSYILLYFYYVYIYVPCIENTSFLSTKKEEKNKIKNPLVFSIHRQKTMNRQFRRGFSHHWIFYSWRRGGRGVPAKILLF